MFKGCSSLISLDLSNFNFGLIKNINGMFSSVKKLEYVNLNNSKNFLQYAKNSGLFQESSDNLVVCIQEDDTTNINNDGGCRIIDCSDNWRNNQNKIDAYNLKCVEINQCNLTDNIYEYENKCYKECPNDTFPVNYICEKYNKFQTTVITHLTERTTEVQYTTELINTYNTVDKIENIYNIKDKIENRSILLNTDFINSDKNICEVFSFLSGECENDYNNKKEQKEFINNVISKIMNGTLNKILDSIIKENKSFIIEEEKIIHQITTLSHIKVINNFTSINFGDCEKILKAKYGINETQELIIYKTEYTIEGYKIPIIDYVIFNEDGSKKLNLDCCNNISIYYNIPVSINEKDLDKYNTTSEYYTNECTKAKSEDGVDMTIFDRKNEFNEKNMSLCEFNCTYKGYNSKTLKAECACPPKGEIDSSETKDKLNKLETEKKSTNFDVTQCFNSINAKEDLGSNSGFFILLFILACFLIIFIIFCIRGKQNLINKIDEIIYKKFKKDKNKIEKNKSKPNILSNNINNRNNLHGNILTRKKKGTTKIKKKNNKNNKIKSDKFIKPTLENKAELKLISKVANISQEKLSKKLNDYELNTLEYGEAFNYDKRTYCDYYLSLIRTKQMIIFSLCSFDDYNSGIIKKYVLFLYFAFHYTSSAVFFTDKTMHQIVEDKGSFNFSYQMKFILFSSIISTICLRIFLLLIKTEKEIVTIKNEQNKNVINIQKEKIIKCINIKYSIFFVLNLILLMLFWYYLTCFNAIYQNTQIYLIKNTFINFGLSLIYPFVINIFPGILRIYSLKKENSKINRKNKNNKQQEKKGDKECIYNASKFLQLL